MVCTYTYTLGGSSWLWLRADAAECEVEGGSDFIKLLLYYHMLFGRGGGEGCLGSGGGGGKPTMRAQRRSTVVLKSARDTSGDQSSRACSTS